MALEAGEASMFTNTSFSPAFSLALMWFNAALHTHTLYGCQALHCFFIYTSSGMDTQFGIHLLYFGNAD